MAATSSPSPMLFSVLSSSQDGTDDLVHQLRNHLLQIEANVQQTLNKIRHRQPFALLTSNITTIDEKNRKNFLHVLQDVATKNNLPFDEPLFRRQVLENNDSSPSPRVDVVRAKPSFTHDAHDLQLSPMNNARRSQFAPVLSSTPVHQTSPIMPIPVDLTMATPSATPAFAVNSADLPAIPPSAIVPQRANLARKGANRPPRAPRAESVTRQKKNPSPIKEQHAEDETVVAEEIRLTSKRRIQTKQEIIEDNVQVIIEKTNEITTDMIRTVQATPLRGRKKKVVQEEPEPIPQLQPPPPIPAEEEVRPKTARAGRSKKKGEDVAPVVMVQPTRTSSLRQRKKPEEVREVTPSPPKKITRNRKKIDNPTEESASVPKVRATPMRGKKKSPPEPSEPVIPLSPKKTTTRSKKRKDNVDQQENPSDVIQPPSPKRRGGRKVKSIDPAPMTITPPTKEQEQPIAPTRSSRRGKKDVELPIEKQDEIVLQKKPRAGRGKKLNEPTIHADVPMAIVDVVMTSVAISRPIPSSVSLDSIVAKPPRPPVARKKKSIAMPPISQMSPSTPPSTSQRIQSTSPINDKPLLPIPLVGRRRQPKRRGATSPPPFDAVLEELPSTNRNQKRTRSSVATTPKRARRENLVAISVPGTPGKKRNKCTCEKRRNGKCDICASAIDA